MKKCTIITLILCLFTCIFAGCSAKVYKNEDFKKDGYTVNKDLSYVSFIVPNRYEDKKINSEEIVLKENTEDKYKDCVHYFLFNTSAAKYVKDNEFFINVVKIDSYKNISEITCAKDTNEFLSDDLGLDIQNSKNNPKPIIKNSGKKTRTTVKANVKKTLEGNIFKSYIGLIRDEKKDIAYAIIVGYNDDSHDKEAKVIAENLYFIKK